MWSRLAFLGQTHSRLKILYDLTIWFVLATPREGMIERCTILYARIWPKLISQDPRQLDLFHAKHQTVFQLTFLNKYKKCILAYSYIVSNWVCSRKWKKKKPSLCRFFSTKSIICGKNRQKFRLKSVTFI